MKKLIGFCLLLSALNAPVQAHHLTPCLDPTPNACKCVTAECAAGLRPITPKPLNQCVAACSAGGTAVCYAASLKIKNKEKRKQFLYACQAGKFPLCVKLCK